MKNHPARGLLFWISLVCVASTLLMSQSTQAVGLSYKEILRLWNMNGQLQVWQPDSDPIPTLTTDASPSGVSQIPAEAFSWNPSGTRLLISYADGLRIWDFEVGKVINQMADVAGGDVAWSPNGKWLAVHNGAGLQILDAQTGRLIQDCGKFGGHTNTVWSPDSRVVASGEAGVENDDRAIVFCQFGSGVVPFIQPAYYPSYLAFSPDGKKLAAISDSYDFTPYIRVYDVATKQLDATLQGAYALAWSTSGNGLVTTTHKLIQIRDAKTYLPLINIPQSASVLAWRPGSNRLVTTGANDTLQVYDTVNGTLLATIQNVGLQHTNYMARGIPNAIQWSPDGSKFALLDTEGFIRVFTESGSAPPSAIPTQQTALQLPSTVASVSRPATDASPAHLHRVDMAHVNQNPYSWSADGSTTFRISESPAAGTIAPHRTTGAIINWFFNWPFTLYDQTNDYSFDASQTSYGDYSRMTLYRNGALIWGVEPDPVLGLLSQPSTASMPQIAPTFVP